MKLINTLILSLLCITVWANGGPVDGAFIHQTGNVQLMQQSDIQLLEEDLQIEFQKEYASIVVVYKLQNNGDATRVDYGFPVDYYAALMDGEDDVIGNFAFYVNDGKLEITNRIEENAFETSPLSPDLDAPSKVKVHRKWFISQVPFEANETIELKVVYQMAYTFQDWETSKSMFTSYSDRYFMYDFSPASKWGDGTVGTLHVELKTAIPIQPKFEGINLVMGADFQYALDGKKDVNLADLGSMTVSFSPSDLYYSQQLLDYRISNTDIKKITASSTLMGTYEAENLLDGMYETAWVEGKAGVGVGESIEIELKEPMAIMGVALLNGYMKDADVYEKNGQVTEIKVELFDEKGEKLSWSGDAMPLVDRSEVFVDEMHGMVQDNTLGKVADVVFDVGEAMFKAAKVRVTIMNAKAGSKYDDICITELLLLKADWAE